MSNHDIIQLFGFAVSLAFWWMERRAIQSHRRWMDLIDALDRHIERRGEQP